MSSRKSTGEDSDSSSLSCLELGGDCYMAPWHCKSSVQVWRALNMGSKGMSWVKLFSLVFFFFLIFHEGWDSNNRALGQIE